MCFQFVSDEEETCNKLERVILISFAKFFFSDFSERLLYSTK